MRSVPAAEILAASEGIEPGKEVAACYRELCNADVREDIVVDSKDLFSTIYIQRNSTDRSIRGDVWAIRFVSAKNYVCNISWILGRCNIADVLAEVDSPLTNALQLIIHTVKSAIDLESTVESKSSAKNFGEKMSDID